MLQNKKILLGISGSIAAYKIPNLVRLLVKQGAEVKIIMTKAATEFVSPLALATVSKNAVMSSLAANDAWHNHIELALWADLFVVAPVSANTLGKMANGLCDNMLLAAYLAARCPVWLAPAMDVDMWEHAATQRNIALLSTYPRHRILPVGDGELASGLVGKGRMYEIEDIAAAINEYFEPAKPKASLANSSDLAGKRVLLTSGGTIEPIDPVRFISNHSTGKMGAAMALDLAARGAEVVFLRAGSSIKPQHENIKVVSVESAKELYQAAMEAFPTCDAAIFAAAVADYTPAEVATQKIKKNSDTFEIVLTKTKDVAAELGKIKSDRQITVGFALETNNAVAHAEKKLSSKNLDFIVLNTLEDTGAGFGHDSNKVTLIARKQPAESLPLMSKTDTARAIIDRLETFFVPSLATK
jgi:phosphopantothenoylcysteine decarboxylase/phosphopantothenate--cysteine ligase